MIVEETPILRAEITRHRAEERKPQAAGGNIFYNIAKHFAKLRAVSARIITIEATTHGSRFIGAEPF